MSAESFTGNDAKTKSYVVDLPGLEGPRVRVLWPGGSASLALPQGAIQLTVGRSKTCDLCVDHGSVSRRHLVVHGSASDGNGARRFEVEDLGGSNGTRLNGKWLPPSARQAFAPADVVELGGAVLVVQRGGSEAVPTTAASRTKSERSTAASASPGQAVTPVFLSEAMQGLYRNIDLLAPSRINVLLVGETGTGKEVAARAVHARSPRAHAAFVPLNCASMPEHLLESELFGYERGAFTGADRAKPGLIEAAAGGTLLLDEVGEMPLATQAKLLRVLEQREVWRVGSLRGRAIDVRFIAATNCSLEAMVAQGRFRQDLFFRLDGLTLRVPPLRERVEDIWPLAKCFAESAAREQGLQPPSLTPRAAELLRTHAWPGNVRELRNAVERALLVSRGQALDVEHFRLTAQALPASQPNNPAANSSSSTPASIANELERVERDAMIAALEKTGGNQTRAAELLGMSRRTFVKRLRQYGIPRPRNKI